MAAPTPESPPQPADSSSPPPQPADSSSSPQPADPSSFQPRDCTALPPTISQPNEHWLTILDSPCTFSAAIFRAVMLNLIRNPNITSTHLFRADILYDSDTDPDAALVPHMQAHLRPIPCALPGFTTARTLVRTLVPRNPQLDAPLVQTCHFLSRTPDVAAADDDDTDQLVVYIPHVSAAATMPFYHPAVARVAFTRHAARSSDDDPRISLSYALFPDSPLSARTTRTALKLLATLHRHGQGRRAGYVKRVQLDRVVPQRRFQETYARLKARHGRWLARRWVEPTDPAKHVFEDIAIAAFLIELWRDMYGGGDSDGGGDADAEAGDADSPPPRFPGFVDLGCGNGVLVYVLVSEGYAGWGLDARARKTWGIFPPGVRARLARRVLVPAVLGARSASSSPLADTPDKDDTPDTPDTASAASADDPSSPPPTHNGLFPPHTFLIANHADQLTAWTPLLAHLSRSAFLAIPCCSHDLSGARFRFAASHAPSSAPRRPQEGESGSLARPAGQPSAYATLCAYVARLAREAGFAVQGETLRIPSTRNWGVVGRDGPAGEGGGDDDERWGRVVGIVEREVGRGVEAVGREWTGRMAGVAAKPGSGH